MGNISRRFADIPTPAPKPADKAPARLAKARAALTVSNMSKSNTPSPDAPAFDKRAYQRGYMAKRRAAAKQKAEA